MPRRIFFKKGGLLNSPPPPVGYEFVGLNDEGLSRVISDGEQINISPERVDVISFSVINSTSSGPILQAKGFNAYWDKYGQNLLWNVVDTDLNVLGTDLQFSSNGDFSTYLDNFSIGDDKSIVVKGYYYKNQSKEKFRIVGRNYAYWALVGLSNYGRMKSDSSISPSTYGQSLLNYFNTELGVDTDGKGLIFTTNKNLYVHKKSSPPHGSVGWGQVSGQKQFYNSWGITPEGEYLKIGGPGSTQSVSKTHNPNDNRIIGMNRGGYIYDSNVSNLETQSASWLLINRIDIETEDYGPGNYLKGYVVRPMGQDNFLLSHNSDIKQDDKIFLISEPLRGTSMIQEISLNTYLDGNSFGDDISSGLEKAKKNRWGSIWLGDIGLSIGRTKNTTNLSDYRDDPVTDRNTRWRVAYGKDGNYTISDDYIWVKANGHITTAYVNREI